MDNKIKKELTKELIALNKQYQKEYSTSDLILRSYFREHSNYNERAYLKIWGTFTKFKESILEKKKEGYSREEFSIIKKRKKSKRYVVSSIVFGAPVHEGFLKSIETYCKHNDAKLVLLAMRGVSVKDKLSEEFHERFKDNLATEFRFNDNLIAMDFQISPFQILPLTGLRRYGSKKNSVIVASTKQFLETVAQIQGKIPHILVSSGTISKPQYSDNRIGRFADQDNLLSGLVVEIRDNQIFHLRQIQADSSGGFQDLGKYYSKNNIKKIDAEAISSEPHFGVEDELAMEATKDIIKVTNCKRLFLHDIIDMRSINPHEKDMVSVRHNRPYHQNTLLEELNYAGERLTEIVEDFPKLEIYVVKSNHDDFLKRWLDKGDFIRDKYNVYLGCELMRSLLRRENPIETYLKKNFVKLENLIFLNERGYSLNEVEWGLHGHKGKNGSRGSKISIEEITCDSVVAHTHSPMIYRGVYVSGCDCQLVQEYNKEGGSSWLHSNVVQYENGNRQLIIKINGEWKL